MIKETSVMEYKNERTKLQNEKNDIYEKSSDLYDAVSRPADKKMVNNYRKFYKFL